MDIKIPFKWIKEYIKIDLSPEDFALRLSLSGPSIEKWNFDETLQDYVFDIEVTSNRVDMASVLGIAREAKAVLGGELNINKHNKFVPAKNLPLDVEIKDKDLCRRYQAIVIDNIKVGPSPEYIQKRLLSCGLNSINNVVDITNYVMLEYGQPTHAFDYNKLSGQKIIVRKSKNETIEILGGGEYELKDTLVIADEDSPIAIAGIKGGSKCEVDENTTTIVIEVANFEPVSIRKSSTKELNLRTDASNLFEKGISPDLTNDAINRIIELLIKECKAEIASDIIDVYPEKQPTRIIKFNVDLVKRILGIELKKLEITKTLEALGFECTINQDESIEVTVPYFRYFDIEFDYDLVEEIARVYGYDRIPNILPQGEIPRYGGDPKLTFEDKIRDILSGAGLTETYTYSLVSEKYFEIAQLDSKDALELHNPLTADYTHMRIELASSLLKILGENEESRESIKIFEVSNIYRVENKNDLPIEESRLVIAANSTKEHDAYYVVKGYLEFLFGKLEIAEDEVEFNVVKDKTPFRGNAAAEIIVKGKVIGYIGEINEIAKEKAGIKKSTSYAEISIDELFSLIGKDTKIFMPVPKYPYVIRDLSFVLPKEILWMDIVKLVRYICDDLFYKAELFDIYQGKVEPTKKSITFRLTLLSNEKTLEEEEINSVIKKVAEGMKNEFGAELRGME